MRRALRIGAALAACLCLPAAAGAGELRGRVTLAIEGASLVDLGPTVVFLDAGPNVPPPAGARRQVLRQRDARFDPEFLVVQAGRPLAMPNDDTIFHNVFSFSEPNQFDLGIYPGGESRTVVFEHPGLVKVYCSIHESMSATVLVTPSPWYARAGADGSYHIEDVPPGRYRLTAWNERLPESTRSIVVEVGGTSRADFSLGTGSSRVGNAAP